jgi:hypothetical protein
MIKIDNRKPSNRKRKIFLSFPVLFLYVLTPAPSCPVNGTLTVKITGTSLIVATVLAKRLNKGFITYHKDNFSLALHANKTKAVSEILQAGFIPVTNSAEAGMPVTVRLHA